MYFEFKDTIPHSVWYDAYNHKDGSVREAFESGSTADYLQICIYILNTQKNPFNYLKVFGDEIICTFGDDYKFGGWARPERKVGDKFWVMYESKDSSYSISSLYDGYFDVVVTLPNYVVQSKEPLSVLFRLATTSLLFM